MDYDYPRPDHDAGSVLALSFVRLFQALDYHVIYVPVAVGAGSVGDPERLRAMGVTILRRAYRRSIPALLHRIGNRVDVVLLSRVDVGGRYVDAVRAHCTKAKVMFNTVDLHWLREAREADLSHDRVAMYRAMATREREIYVARMADAALVVSTVEKSLLEEAAPGATVVWCPSIHDVPGNGNDYAARSGLAFLGGFLRRPNVDAVEYFLDSVWPLIRQIIPEARFYAVGPNMPAHLAARSDPGFVPVGHVPDLSPWLERVRLTVAPLRYGAGTKGKVITSLAHGVPCVATSLAAEGMQLDDSAILIADDPESIAASVTNVYRDPVIWASLSQGGIAWALRHHTLEAVMRPFTNALRAIGAPAGQQRSLACPEPGVESTTTAPKAT